jgi:uncharacterized protein YqjF (DUF2071 family)
MPTRPFLVAEWRNLAMLNYAVDPRLIRALVPGGTELDEFDGKVYVSLVGFRFLQTRVRGLRIPFHSDFDEINLRFYVSPKGPGPRRRGVAFIREIVPRYAIAKIARIAYHEPYVSLPMRHVVGETSVEYAWRLDGKWNTLQLDFDGSPALPAEGSAEQFIAEHYWGYTAQPDGGTLEYQVEHVPWRVWRATSAHFEGDASSLYGSELAACLKQTPDSAFLADGSGVVVYGGTRL